MHHVFHEDVVDLVTRGAEVFLFQFRPDIIGQDQVNLFSQSVFDVVLCFDVSGIDHRELVP